MNLAIIGSRAFHDYPLLLDFLIKHFFNEWTQRFIIDKIISGGARGADRLGERFADDYKIEKQIFKPEWDKYGKRAGMIRNAQIVDACDMVLAFWDGISSGTYGTINLAKTAKKPTLIVYY